MTKKSDKPSGSWRMHQRRRSYLATVGFGTAAELETIAAGNIILAHESPGEGWWEAIVISRDDAILTLRYWDYPKAPKFERHVSTVALINPRPA